MIRINWRDYGTKDPIRRGRTATVHNQKNANKVIGKFLANFKFKKNKFRTPVAKISIDRRGIIIRLW